MKKLILLLGLVVLMGCAEPNNAPQEDEQDYTSFVFEQVVNNSLPNCVAGYFNPEGLCIKLGDLGSLSLNDISPEIKVEDHSITEVYFFTDYISPRMFNKKFILQKNKRNIFKLTEDIGGTSVNKSDPTKYPQ